MSIPNKKNHHIWARLQIVILIFNLEGAVLFTYLHIMFITILSLLYD